MTSSLLQAPSAPARYRKASAPEFAPADSATARSLPAGCPILCLSHLRWNFVYQRPQHLMTRFAKRHPVYYVEEPVPLDDAPPRLDAHDISRNLQVIVPRLPGELCAPGHRGGEAVLRRLLAQWLLEHRTDDGKGPILWYYTPMSLGFTANVAARLVVYDCMDELSNFQNAPKALRARERLLMSRADVVFTGGHSLYEVKRKQHPNAHPFPSSVDLAHFGQARQATVDPADMADIPHPRIGFYGVVDERFDIELLAALAAARPDWHWVVLGPVVKIDPATLPRAANLHYLGGKRYEELPAYLGRWDVAMMPFALNASTKFISPTKTPEYLAGGCPVVSTPITDVVRGYGHSPLVRIADGAEAFAAAVGEALKDRARSPDLCSRADALLHGLSWDRTQAEMAALMAQRLHTRPHRPVVDTRQPVLTLNV